MNTKAYVDQNKDRFIDELVDLLKIPSISADKAYKDDVIKTSEVVKTALEKAGCDKVEICDTPGYPIVYGKFIGDRSGRSFALYFDFKGKEIVDIYHCTLYGDMSEDFPF